MALDGLEKQLEEKFWQTAKLRAANKVNYVRYADDFIITGSSKTLLGQNIRKYKGKFLIKPSKKNLKNFLNKIRTIITENKTTPAYLLIAQLNPVIMGWANYHRHVVAKKAYSYVDNQIWSKLSASWSVRWQQRKNGYHPYTKVDCKLMWDEKKYNIFVKADNITCHRYYVLTAVKQPGLWIMAGASVNLGR